MELNRSKPYGLIQGDERSGASYEQDGKLFDSAGRWIDPATITPEKPPVENKDSAISKLKNQIDVIETHNSRLQKKIEDLLAENDRLKKEAAKPKDPTKGLTWDQAKAKTEDYENRLLVVDENLDGYMSNDEIRDALEKIGVATKPQWQRSVLVKTLKETLGIEE